MTSAVRPARRSTPSARTLARQRRLLEDELAVLRHGLDASSRQVELWKGSEPVEVSFDEEGGEGSALGVELQNEEALQYRPAQNLTEVEAAIARLEGGTYGRCETCGDPIGAARLEAVPTARQCVSCKSAGPLRRRVRA